MEDSLERARRPEKYSLDMILFMPNKAKIIIAGNAKNAAFARNVEINTKPVITTKVKSVVLGIRREIEVTAASAMSRLLQEFVVVEYINKKAPRYKA